MIVAPNDVGNPHFGVIHDAGKIIRWKAVGLEDDKILNQRRIKGNDAMYEVINLRNAIQHFKTDGLAALGVRVVKSLILQNQILGILFINQQPITLEIGTLVPVEAKPLHTIKNCLSGLRCGALLIGILYAQEKNPFMVTREKPIKKGRPRPSIWRYPVGLGAKRTRTLDIKLFPFLFSMLHEPVIYEETYFFIAEYDNES